VDKISFNSSSDLLNPGNEHPVDRCPASHPSACQKVSLYFVSSCSDQRAKTGASLEKRCDKFMRLGLNLSALASKEFQGKQPSLPTGKLGYAQARNPVKQRTAYRTNTNANLCGNVGKLRRQYLVVTSAQIVSY
jgi:hypothetical protein